MKGKHFRSSAFIYSSSNLMQISFPLWIAIAIIFVMWGVIIFFYYRQDKPISRLVRAILMALRCLSAGIVIFCLLEPTIVSQHYINRKSNLLMLVDSSKSMSLRDMPGSRIDVVKNLMNDALNALSDRFDLKLYQFSSDAESVEELTYDAEGAITDIEKSISSAASEWRGQPVAGVVLITDGASNSGANPINTVQNIGLPVYTIGVGRSEMLKDIQILRAEFNPIAYIDHILPVRVVIKSKGYDGYETRVSLTQGNVLRDSVSLKLDSQSGEQIADLQFSPSQEGMLKLSVSVPSAPGESATQNNSYTFFVRVLKAKLKVLYIEGRLRWEYTFINRSLRRDPNIDVTSLIAGKQDFYSISDKPSFPAKNELFNYDVIMIGNIGPSFFKGEQLSLIRDFVEGKGGALILLGGQNSFGPGGFGESTLKDMLPFEIGKGGTKLAKGPFNPELTQYGMIHPITRISDDQAENTAIWRDLPAINQVYYGNGMKSGATVLLKTQQEDKPLIAFQRYGEGVVLMIASDDLWQWAFGGYPFGIGDSHYRKLWTGAIRWLASISTNADRLIVKTDKQAYFREEKVRIIVYAYDESYETVNDAQIKSQIQTPGGTSSDLIFSSDGNGRYSAEFSPILEGSYKVSVEARKGEILIGKGSTEFIVQSVAIEFQDTQLNERLLRELANSSGGAYYYITDISKLPSALRESDNTFLSVTEHGIWDNPVIFIILIVLLGSEWFLRKKKGLV